MIDLIENRLPELRRLCQEHDVARLEVFGSAVTGEFRDDSDLDFLVKFNDKASERCWFYFDFQEALADLYGRKVDLLTAKDSYRNPYFDRSVAESRVVVYES